MTETIEKSVAVDIGGTFTDLVCYDAQSGTLVQSKSLTTHDELSRGVWDCLSKAGISLPEVDALIHGSTVAINIAVEEKGAKTALVVTAGTRDVYKIGRQNRPEAYNFAFERPRPLVSRALTFEANERLSAAGEAIQPLAEADAQAIVDAIAGEDVDAVAVCLLHSYANPEHELAIGERLKAKLGDAFVTLSHDITREYREYERISTTVMNAYIGPKTSAYVGRIQDRLLDEGFAGRFMVMQSNGGVMSPERARSLPVAMMESGPVGGVIAAAEVARALGFENVISFDMGGTTAKASLIADGKPSIAQGYYVGSYASGHPVMFPVVDIIEVGAGGGSIAWIDELGSLKLGPQSAGSDPGPICYGRGGELPTVTDANVILGRIGATSFLGGDMQLDAASARAGVERKLQPALGLDVDAIAQGIIQIAVAKMSLAVRGVSVERGYDPRDFAMVATGGAGPLHGLQVARELNIPTVIIPNLPAHFSAVGMLLSDVRHDYVRTYYRKLEDADFSEVETIGGELRENGRRALEQSGVPETGRSYQLWMDLRYVGQEFWLQVPVEHDEVERSDVAAIAARFNAMHDHRFGHAASDEPLELVNLRLTAIGTRPKIRFGKTQESGAVEQAERAIIFSDATQSRSSAVYRRERLTPGMRITGPCVIEEYGTTTVLFEGDHLTVAPTGELIIKVGTAA